MIDIYCYSPFFSKERFQVFKLVRRGDRLEWTEMAISIRGGINKCTFSLCEIEKEWKHEAPAI